MARTAILVVRRFSSGRISHHPGGRSAVLIPDRSRAGVSPLFRGHGAILSLEDTGSG